MLFRSPWVRLAAIVLAVPAFALLVAFVYYYVTFARLIDTRLHGERDTVLPRVFARPLELRRGQAMTERQLVDRLNDLGYAQRPKAERAGEFAVGDAAVTLMLQCPRAVTDPGILAPPAADAGRPAARLRRPRRL